MSDLAYIIAAARAALAEGLFSDVFTTERGSSGACGVKNASGDGTPITIHCAVTADILPSDTVFLNSRTYTVIDSHGTHGLSLAKHYTLLETAREALYPAYWILDADESAVVDQDGQAVTDT